MMRVSFWTKIIKIFLPLILFATALVQIFPSTPAQKEVAVAAEEDIEEEAVAVESDEVVEEEHLHYRPQTINFGDEVVFRSSAHGTFFANVDGQPNGVDSTSTQTTVFEFIKVENKEDTSRIKAGDRVFLKSKDGKYLNATDGNIQFVDLPDDAKSEWIIVDNGFFKKDATGSGKRLIDGFFFGLRSGEDKRYLGLDKNNGAYYSKQYHPEEQFQVFIVTRQPEYKPLKFPDNFEKMKDIKLTQIDVDGDGNPVGLNDDGYVMRWDPDSRSWSKVGDKKFHLVKVGEDGALWGLGGDPDDYIKKYKVYKMFYWESGKWKSNPGAQVDFDIAGRERLFSVTDDGEVWTMNTQIEYKPVKKKKKVKTNYFTGRTLWKTWTDYEIISKKGNWRPLPRGRLTGISVAPDGSVVGFNGSGELFFYNESLQDFISFDGGATQISLGSNYHLIALRPNGGVYRITSLLGRNPNWEEITTSDSRGRIKGVATNSSGVIFLLDNDGRLWKESKVVRGAIEDDTTMVPEEGDEEGDEE